MENARRQLIEKGMLDEDGEPIKETKKKGN